ncbi:MAG: hypothetical protein ACWA40_04700 [Planktomarina sp.]
MFLHFSPIMIIRPLRDILRVKPKPIAAVVLLISLGHGPSVQAEAMLMQRCDLFYSPRFEASIFECPNWAPNVMVADLEMKNDVSWPAFKDRIEHVGRSFNTSRARHVEALTALRGLLENCLSESCQLDPSLSKADIRQLRAALNDQGNLKGRRTKYSLFRFVPEKIDLFYTENPSFKVVFGYPKEYPLNHVKSHTFFYIFRGCTRLLFQ